MSINKGSKYSIDQKTLVDNWQHKGLRKRLIESLRSKFHFREDILDVMESIPRHFFLDKAFEEWAYKDVPFRIDADQTISQPYTVAFQTQLLDIQPGDKILEIGTGSGYQAIVLYKLGAKVYTIERHEILFHQTNDLLKKMKAGQIRTFLGDGFNGISRYAPFDKILITAGSSEIPKLLLDQLAEPGIMVIPFGSRDVQIMKRIEKDCEGNLKEIDHGEFRFVPMLTGINYQKDRGQ